MKIYSYKNLLFTAILTLLVLFIVELLSYFSYAAQNSTFKFNKYDGQIAKAAGKFGSNQFDPNGEAQVAVHPYLGYTPNPRGLTAKDHNGTNISEYGFIDNHSPIHAREPNQVLIGIAGGSVAAWFFVEAKNDLEIALRKSAYFKDKKIEFIDMAAGGYKQPQQLLGLSYLLSLGANFDMVINIDGFNDLVMPIFYNLPKSVFPFYPTNWYATSQISQPGSYLPIVDKVKSIEENRIALANLMEKSILGSSIFLRMVWFNYDKLQESNINKLKKEFTEKSAQKSSFTTSGPSFNKPSTDAELYQVLAKYWATCSKQMRLLSNANKIKYYHFLQANQYVPKSKVLSKEELVSAYDESTTMGFISKNGYWALQKEGDLLKAEGENYYDLTNIFQSNSETIYVDKCCHYNKHGLTIMANEIASRIIKSYGNPL